MTRLMSILTLTVLAGMLLILFLNLSFLFYGQKEERFLPYNHVKGMDLLYKGKLWTLNFDQQKSVIAAINHSVPIGKSSSFAHQLTFPYERLIIYRFKDSDLILVPYSLDDKKLVYASKELTSDYLLDVSGNLDSLLRETYDP